jgi:hypothetical protein
MKHFLREQGIVTEEILLIGLGVALVTRKRLNVDCGLALNENVEEIEDEIGPIKNAEHIVFHRL